MTPFENESYPLKDPEFREIVIKFTISRHELMFFFLKLGFFITHLPAQIEFGAVFTLRVPTINFAGGTYMYLRISTYILALIFDVTAFGVLLRSIYQAQT